MIISTHLISSTSSGHVHSFHCLWFKNILGGKEDIVPEHCKNHDYELVSSRWENLPSAYKPYITSDEYKNCRTAIILQFLVDFIQLLF